MKTHTHRHHEQHGARGGRRLDVVPYLAFGVMLAAGAAVLPLVADTHRLAGLWITFCAAIGLK